jgi:hypothetical protein
MPVYHMRRAVSSVVTAFHDAQKGLPGLAAAGFLLTESQKILNELSYTQLQFVIDMAHHLLVLLRVLHEVMHTRIIRSTYMFVT